MTGMSKYGRFAGWCRPSRDLPVGAPITELQSIDSIGVVGPSGVHGVASRVLRSGSGGGRYRRQAPRERQGKTLATMTEIASIPLPNGAFDWAVEDDLLLFFEPNRFSAWSLADGSCVWSRDGRGPYATRVLGVHRDTLILHLTMRQISHGVTLGLDVGSGKTRWVQSQSPKLLGRGIIQGDRVLVGSGSPPSNALSIDPLTGGMEPAAEGVPQRLWNAHGMFYGVSKGYLVRYDGVTVSRVCSTNKLWPIGVSGAYAVLGSPHNPSTAIARVDLVTAQVDLLEFDSPHWVASAGERLVLSAAEPDTEAFAIDLPHASGALTAAPRAWSGPRCFAVGTLGRAVSASGLGVLDSRDGSILWSDRNANRWGGDLPRVVLWAMHRRDAGASVLHLLD